MNQWICLYLLTLGIHVLWLLYAWKTGKARRYPLVFACFLGMFLLNAVGSIFVAHPELFGRNEYCSPEFFVLLNGQALIFYVVAGVYFFLSRAGSPPVAQYPSRADYVFGWLLLGAAALIAVHYVVNVGTPPLIDILRGLVAPEDLVEFRTSRTLGLDNYYFYSLGFSILPQLAAAQFFLYALMHRRGWIVTWCLIAVSAFLTILPGGKGNLLDIVLILLATYLLYCGGATILGPRPLAYWLPVAVFVIGFAGVTQMYCIYRDSAGASLELFGDMLYRIVGVYSESMAASVYYVQTHGFFHGATLPTVWGLVPHETIRFDQEMHAFLFGGAEGNAPCGATVDGYINFGWTGFVLMATITFLVVVGTEEFLKRVQGNAFGFSLMALYGVFAFKLAALPLTSNFFSLFFALVFAAIFGCRFVFGLLFPANMSPEAVGA